MTQEEIEKLRQADPATLTPMERRLLNLKPNVIGQPSRNPAGRGPVPSKLTKDVKEVFALAVERLQPEFEAALTALLQSENEFARAKAMDVYLRFTEFTKPRLSAMAVKSEGTGNNIIVIGNPTELGGDAETQSSGDSDTNNNTIDVTPEE